MCNTPRPWLTGLLLVLAVYVLLLNGCSKKDESTSPPPPLKVVIQIAGSDTMVNLAQAWAEAYAKVSPNVSIEVSGGG